MPECWNAGMLECQNAWNARMPGMPDAGMPGMPGMPDAGMPGMPECQKLHTVQVHSTAAFWSGWHNGRLFLTVTYSVMHKYCGTVVE